MIKKIMMMLSVMNSVFYANNMLVEMGTMVASQFAGSAANQAVTSEFSDMAQAFGKGQADILRAMNNFSTQQQAAQKKTLTNSFALLNKAQSNVSLILQAQQTNFSDMLAYVQSTISRQQPLVNYVQQPVLYDQIFTAGRMLTPQGLDWYNLFPVGNWEYDGTTDSFWQMSNVAIADVTQNATQAYQSCANNLIFTEWYPHVSTYTLEFEINLYQYTTPCFIGIFFNRSRWISGDLTTFQKGRLFGLFNLDDKTMQCSFAESYMQNLNNNTPSLVTPVYQIMSDYAATKLSMEVPENIFINSQGQHSIFHIKLVVSADQVQYKIWVLPDEEPKNYQLLKKLHKDLFLYHGIGFIAAGCVAEFKIIQPTDLLFSKTDIAAFNDQLAKEIKQEQTKINITQINDIAGETV